MISTNFLKDKLASGKVCIGTWITIPSTEIIEIAALAGMDFVVIDTEHGPIGLETAQKMVVSAERHGASPIFRVPVISRDHILSSLEIGVHGLQVPNVGKGKDLEDLIRFSFFPPKGIRGFSPFNRASQYSSVNAVKKANSDMNVLRIVHIEGKDGVESIDEILTFQDVDIFFLGLYDLSLYLGEPGNFSSKPFFELYNFLSKKILESGKILGSIASSREQLKFLVNSGARYITYTADCDVLSRAYSEINNDFRGII